MSGPHETNTQPHIDDFDLTDVPDARTEIVPQASLLVATGANAGRTYPLVGRDTIIGRSPSAQVRVDEPGVSAKHAQITLRADQHMLVDLDSTNGTFLNGKKLEARQQVPLAPGDSLQIAETVLAYVAGSGDRVEPTRQLSKLAPMFPDTAMLRAPEAQILAHLLQVSPGAMAPAKTTVSLEEQVARIARFFQVIRRHWVLLFACTALSALILDAAVFINPPPSEATFHLRVSPPKSKDPFNETYAQQYDLDLFYAGTEQNFLNPALVGQTLARVNKVPPSRELVVATMASLKFDSIGEALYRGTFKDASPGFSVNFLKSHLEAFVASEIQRSVHVAQAEVDFLSARLKEAETELLKTEKLLQEFKGKHLEGLPENAGDHLSSRETLLTRRAELGAQLEKTRLELELARKQFAEEAPLDVKKAEGSEAIERSLTDVRKQLSEARSKGLGESHPQVEALKKQIVDLERMAADARKKSSNDLDRSGNAGLVALRNRVGELEVAYKGTKAELGSIGGLVTRLDSIVGTMPEVEARYSELTRSYVNTKDMHAKLFDKLRSNQLQLELERASAKARYEVIAPPETSGLPLRRALTLRTVTGCAIGLLLGGALIAFLELRRYLRERRATSLAIVPVARSRAE